MASATMQAQVDLEEAVGEIFGKWVLEGGNVHRPQGLRLLRERHISYLIQGLQHLPSGFASLDASRPWLCFWILHSLALLGEPLDMDLAERCIHTLARCRDKSGGYGGGPGQMGHVVTTYAAVMALVTIGGRRALESIDREAVLQFLLAMKDRETGAFRVHEGGEMDVRGCYTALAVAHILNLPMAELARGVGQFVASCQTYEGGIGGEPGNEAHGGYTFCGLAALILAGADVEACLDLPLLLKWLARRQGAAEGGFQGRTNKLVDGCYSFWQGGLFPLLHLIGQRHRTGGKCTAPPQSGYRMRPAGEASRQAGEAPGQAGEAPRQAGEVLGQAGEALRPAGEASGQAGEASRPAGEASRQAGEASTQAGEASTQPGEASTQPGEASVQARLTGHRGGAQAVSVYREPAPEAAPAAAPETTTASTEATPAQPPAAAAPAAAPVSAEAAPAPAAGAKTVAPATPTASAEAAPDGTGGMVGAEGMPREERGEEEEEEEEEAFVPRFPIAFAVDIFPPEPPSAAPGDEWFHGQSMWCCELGAVGGGSVALNPRALQGYILLCCQVPEGGLRDKPGKGRDYYHTCYCLSGLSTAQHVGHPPLVGVYGGRSQGVPRETLNPKEEGAEEKGESEMVVVGPPASALERVEPLCNVLVERYTEAREYFLSLQ